MELMMELISNEFALNWFISMVICSSLAIMITTFIFQNKFIGAKIRRKLLGFFTNSAYLFFLSGILMIFGYGVQMFYNPFNIKYSPTLALLSFSCIYFFIFSITFFVCAIILMFGGLHKINKICGMEENEKTEYRENKVLDNIKKWWQKGKVVLKRKE